MHAKGVTLTAALIQLHSLAFRAEGSRNKSFFYKGRARLSSRKGEAEGCLCSRAGAKARYDQS